MLGIVENVVRRQIARFRRIPPRYIQCESRSPRLKTEEYRLFDSMIEKRVVWRNPIYGTVVCEQRFRFPQQCDPSIRTGQQFRDSAFVTSDFGSPLDAASAERNLFRRFQNFAPWNMLVRPLPKQIAWGLISGR